MIEHKLNLKLTGNKGDFAFNFEADIATQGTSFVYGLSGSGKTTLLRHIAGLEHTENASIQFEGITWQDAHNFIPAQQREIGYVFQEPSLFPHLNVQRNLEYGWLRTPKDKRNIRFSEVIDCFELAPFLHRYSQDLSGGQRQRIALARAILSCPKLLLLDEPFANLDALGKKQIRPYLTHLTKTFGIATFYVSHALEEAIEFADRIILIESGKITTQGTVNEITTNPNLPLAQLDEACSILSGVISHVDNNYHLSDVALEVGSVALARSDLKLQQKVNIRILAQDVSLCLERAKNTSINNILPVMVKSSHPCSNPAHVLVRCQLADNYLLARLTKLSHDQLNIQPGQNVFAQIKSVALISE